MKTFFISLKPLIEFIYWSYVKKKTDLTNKKQEFLPEIILSMCNSLLKLFMSFITYY